jgi:hypothetical protein
MDRQEQERQDVERIMRRAAELGYDPERVARALDHRPPRPVEYQPVVELERQSWFAARVTRRFARRS